MTTLASQLRASSDFIPSAGCAVATATNRSDTHIDIQLTTYTIGVDVSDPATMDHLSDSPHHLLLQPLGIEPEPACSTAGRRIDDVRFELSPLGSTRRIREVDNDKTGIDEARHHKPNLGITAVELPIHGVRTDHSPHALCDPLYSSFKNDMRGYLYDWIANMNGPLLPRERTTEKSSNRTDIQSSSRSRSRQNPCLHRSDSTLLQRQVHTL